MKIKSIQLKPFAGISDKKVKFCPGLTVILGPNEAGKSTLLNALKSVLFTEVELTKVRFDRLMKEYMPVKGGDTIRVSLEFQTEGKDYFLTDGVSVEKLRLRLDREYEDYFQHWDIEKGYRKRSA
jgi:exonuclease SbcC